MAYTKNVWLPRIAQGDNRFTDQNGAIYEFYPAPESVTEHGTPFSAAWMNHLEEGLEDHTEETDNPHAVTATQVKAVPYDEEVTLTDTQKANARHNIDAVASGISEGTITAASGFTDNGSVCQKQGRFVSVIVNGSGSANANETKTLLTLPTGFRPSVMIKQYGTLSNRNGYYTVNTNGTVTWTNTSGATASGEANVGYSFISAE